MNVDSQLERCDGCNAPNHRSGEDGAKWLCEMNGFIFCMECYTIRSLMDLSKGALKRMLTSEQNESTIQSQ